MTKRTRTGPVVVIGGAGGIGTAIAEAAARNGSNVWIADIRDASSTTSRLPGTGHRAVVTDVTDPADVESLIRSCWEDGPPIGLVYAAGLNHTADVADIDSADFGRLFGVNLTGAFQVGKAIQRRLRMQTCTLSMVFVSSVAGLHGEAGGALYCATKFGLLAFVQSFAAEIAEYGCRVNAVCPGNVDTPMLRWLAGKMGERSGIGQDEALRELADATAFRRLLTPAEVANACLWLLSAESSGISGQTIIVDGPAPRT